MQEPAAIVGIGVCSRLLRHASPGWEGVGTLEERGSRSLDYYGT